MSGVFLSTENQPFCKGCGHTLVGRAIEKALGNLDNLDPLDLVVVTDIGCIGIIDRQFKSHTVHGLHGRSVALATGISLGLSNPGKKIIVLIGDGGATIGLHHILEAAHLNINMTVLVHNNMLYGMTGGQPSGLTPHGFKTLTMPDGRMDHGTDLCQLVHSAGGSYARRLYAMGDISEVLEEALRVDGFSLVEAVEFCPSHGIKFNPGKKLHELTEEAGLLPIILENKRASHVSATNAGGESLLKSVKEVKTEFNHDLEGRISLILAGSAGEGVQSSAELLAIAAMSCGLSVTKKGSYPVTVGVGFSLAELIISTDKIDYTGISKIDAALVTSVDGLKKGLSEIEKMTDGTLYLDSSLEEPETAAKVEKKNYREPMGPRSASLLITANFVKETGFIPMDAFYKALAASRISKAIPEEKLRNVLERLS